MPEISDYVDKISEGTRDLGIKETFDYIRDTAALDKFTGEYFTLCRLVGEKIGMNNGRSRSLAILGKAYDVYRLLSDNKDIIGELREAFRQDDPFVYMDDEKTIEKINGHLKTKGHKEVNYDLLVYSMYVADMIGQKRFIELNGVLVNKGLSPFFDFGKPNEQ